LDFQRYQGRKAATSIKLINPKECGDCHSSAALFAKVRVVIDTVVPLRDLRDLLLARYSNS